MKLIFAGTPAFSATILEAIIASGHRVALVLTQPDRPTGRGMTLRASPVKALALASGIEIFQPQTLRDTVAQERVRAVGADVMIVAAYGLILPQAPLRNTVSGQPLAFKAAAKAAAAVASQGKA